MTTYKDDIQEWSSDSPVELPAEKMSRRDYFAGLAMQGLLARCVNHYPSPTPNSEIPMSDAVTYADRLIAELDTTPSK